jgi:ubiquinone/menaquinone biosynthesis C-methylase UbiE
MLWRSHSDAVNSDLLRRWLPRGRAGRLLKTDLFDEACSNGLYPLLQSRARTVYGIDVSDSATHAAKTHYPRLSGTSADVRALPFADGSFDVVFSNSTLDHFQTRGEIAHSIRELSRVLKSGGDLILTLDNAANPVIALRNALPFALLNRLHLVPYFVGATCGQRALRRMVAEAGLEETEVTAIMHCPRVLGVALARMFERFGGGRAQARYLSTLMAFERLARWPSRFVTGHFIAIKATKP